MAATFDQPPSAAPRRRATPARRASHDPFATKGMHTAAQFAIVTNRARSQYRYDVRPPQQLIDSERKEMLHYILDDQFQHLRVLLLSSRGLSYMDINERLPRGQHEGLTLLHLAVIHASAGTVNTLLQLASANPNVKAEKGEHIPSYWRGATPLHLAAEKGYLKTLKFLIGAGAKVDMTDEQLRTPLMSAICHATSRMGHELCARELVRRGADLNARDFMGDGPFHLACDRGEVAMLLLKVISSEATSNVLREVVVAANNARQTALWRACDRGLESASRFLIELGADPNTPAGDGTSPLHIACLRGLEETVNLMLGLPGSRQPAINAAAANGQTPLHFALSHGSAAHKNIAKTLLSRGALAYGRTATGESALHACAQQGNVELAGVLLRQLPRGKSERIVVNQRNIAGSTPLHTAVANSQSDVAKLLMQQVGIARGAYDVHGMTPLHLAVDKNDVKMYFLLLKSGSHRISPKELSLRNDLGWAVLHTAAFRGFEVAARMLLEANAVVDELTADGWTALQLASSQGHARTAAVLIKAGADTAYDEMKT